MTSLTISSPGITAPLSLSEQSPIPARIIPLDQENNSDYILSLARNATDEQKNDLNFYMNLLEECSFDLRNNPNFVLSLVREMGPALKENPQLFNMTLLLVPHDFRYNQNFVFPFIQAMGSKIQKQVYKQALSKAQARRIPASWLQKEALFILSFARSATAEQKNDFNFYRDLLTDCSPKLRENPQFILSLGNGQK